MKTTAKRILVALLIALVCIGIFAGCKQKADNLPAAQDYLKNIYKDKATVTPADFTVLNKLSISDSISAAEWSNDTIGILTLKDTHTLTNGTTISFVNDDQSVMTMLGECAANTSAKISGNLEEAYEQGIVRAIGISNFNKTGYDKFCEQVNIIPFVNQIESNVFFPQNEFKAYMAEKGTVGEAWAPLSSGMGDVQGNEILTKIAAKYGKTNAQVALRYLVQSGTPIIPRSSNPERQKQNLNVFDFALTAEEMAEIGTIDRGKTFHDWMDEWNAEGWNK